MKPNDFFHISFFDIRPFMMIFIRRVYNNNCCKWPQIEKKMRKIIFNLHLNPIKLHSHKQKPNFQFFCRIHLLDQMRFLIAFKSFSKASPGHWISMTLVYGRKWWKWMIEEMHHHLIDCTEIGNHWKHIVLKFQSAFFKNSSLCYLIRNSEPVLFNVGLNGLQKQQFFVQW